MRRHVRRNRLNLCPPSPDQPVVPHRCASRGRVAYCLGHHSNVRHDGNRTHVLTTVLMPACVSAAPWPRQATGPTRLGRVERMAVGASRRWAGPPVANGPSIMSILWPYAAQSHARMLRLSSLRVLTWVADQQRTRIEILAYVESQVAYADLPARTSTACTSCTIF
jgi:hypothetical protein